MVRVSYYEIYNENIKDLLAPDTPPKTLVVREDENKGIFISNIKEEVVTSYEEMIKCVETGSIHRTVGCTLMNETSSRSHSIFTIILEQRISDPSSSGSTSTGCGSSDTDEGFKMAKFHLVDLAGSERNKRTGAQGIRFKEAVQINAGLLALGNVISALGDEKKRGTISHVPYRDSKLTRLLQDSLGGNSRTVMIACVSPADSSFQETLNTLKYANRARNIKNKPVVNTDPHSAQLGRLKDQINALQLELLKQKLQQSDGGGTTLEELLNNEYMRKHLMELQARNMGAMSLNSEEYTQLQQQNRSLKFENDKLQLELDKATEAVSKISDNILNTQSEKDRYALRLYQLKINLKSTVEMMKLFEAKSPLTQEQKQSLREIIAKLEELSRTEASLKSMVGRPASAPLLHNMMLPKDEGTTTEMKRVGSTPNIAGSDEVVINRRDYMMLQKELKDARDDLSRDEKIFSEKMREIKKLNKMNMDLKKDVQTLREQLDNEMKRVVTEQQQQQQHVFNGGKLDDSITIVEENSREEQSRIEIEEQLLEEKQKILEEKNRIEQQKLEIEQQIKEQHKAFLRNQRKMQKNLKDLTLMIRLKEELIRDLMQSDTESQVIRQQYEDKIQKMENEVTSAQQEMEKLVKDLEAADMDKASREKEKKRIMAEYELTLKKTNQQLTDLKKRQHDSERLIREKYRSDKRVRELENEINRMRSQQEFLKKKIKDEADKQAEQSQLQAKQINDLRKEAENSFKRIKELESENTKQKLVLRKRTEEIQRAQAQLTRYKMNRERSINTEIDKQKAWLDKEIEKYLKKKDTMELLEKELKRREAIIKEKENMILTKQKLEEQKMRSSQVMHQGIHGLQKQIEQLDKQIVQKESELKGQKSITGSLMVEGRSLQFSDDEIATLREKRDRALSQMMVLEEKAKVQEYAEEAALRELEERTEVLDAEIEFKNEAIAQAEREIHEDGGTNVVAHAEVSDLSEAKTLLKKYFEKVIELKEEEQKKESKVQQMEIVMQERDKIIENLQNNIRLTEMVYERKLTKQQKENELKIQYLLKQISSLQEKNSILSNSQSSSRGVSNGGSGLMEDEGLKLEGIDRMKVESMIRLKDDQILMLDKDNFYYKQTNKDLKRKLREFKTKSESNDQEVQELKRENASLVEQNEKITQELNNIKTYLFKHTGVVQQVRKSIRSIKDIKGEASWIEGGSGGGGIESVTMMGSSGSSSNLLSALTAGDESSSISALRSRTSRSNSDIESLTSLTTPRSIISNTVTTTTISRSHNTD